MPQHGQILHVKASPNMCRRREILTQTEESLVQNRPVVREGFSTTLRVYSKEMLQTFEQTMMRSNATTEAACDCILGQDTPL